LFFSEYRSSLNNISLVSINEATPLLYANEQV